MGMYTPHRRSGMAALLVVIVIGAAALIYGLAANERGLSTLELIVFDRSYTSLRQDAESCLEEALLRLSFDATWSGDVLSFGDVSCILTVFAPTDTMREMRAVVTRAQQQTSVRVRVVYDGGRWVITEWFE